MTSCMSNTTLEKKSFYFCEADCYGKERHNSMFRRYSNIQSIGKTKDRTWAKLSKICGLMLIDSELDIAVSYPDDKGQVLHGHRIADQKQDCRQIAITYKP